MKILFILTLLFVSQTSFARPTLNHFTSDGCSNWPDGSIFDSTLWKTCCFEHDISYWMGGSEKERLQADEKLKMCVGDRVHFMAGWVMYSGVRVGGGPGYDTPYRWGYGWSEARGYRRLTPFEKDEVEYELSRTCFIGEEQGIIERSMREKKMKTVPRFRFH